MTISRKVLQQLADKTYVCKALQAGQVGQAIFGYSDEEMALLYLKAHHFLEEKQGEKAVDAFTFLVTLNPLHYEYWMGLGVALQMIHDYEPAIDAYEMAAIYNVEHPLPYLYLGKCLFAIHDRKSALQAFDLAIAYAEESEEYNGIREEAKNAREHLLNIE